jgi:hypothetical protein
MATKARRGIAAHITALQCTCADAASVVAAANLDKDRHREAGILTPVHACGTPSKMMVRVFLFVSSFFGLMPSADAAWVAKVPECRFKWPKEERQRGRSKERAVVST